MTSTATKRVAANIRAEMARRGLTQGEVAARVGMTQQAVSRRLSGRFGITVDDLERFCAALGLTVEQALDMSPLPQHADWQSDESGTAGAKAPVGSDA